MHVRILQECEVLVSFEYYSSTCPRTLRSCQSNTVVLSLLGLINPGVMLTSSLKLDKGSV